ncbi:MAG: RNA polymerase sigma factor [Spirochaetales bacterium]|nr:RNA polymerase sigma factor [Spirochaetales bacterium]
MANPFVEIEYQVEQEKALVARAQAGETDALERLIRLHQGWVFNIVLRMVSDYHLAEDVSQEVLVRAFSKLSSFKGKSRFRTWLYRIAVNQVLNMKKTRQEENHEKYGRLWADDRYVEDFISQNVPDHRFASAEAAALAGEVTVKCLLGMLLCLPRKQRIVYILGAILHVNGRTAGEIVGMTEANFRQILSRSRRRLWNFLNERCGLVNPAKPCRCERCLSACIKTDFIDPLHAVFNVSGTPKVREIISRSRENLRRLQYERCQELYRDHPFQNSPDFSAKVVEILNGEECRHLLDIAPRT